MASSRRSSSVTSALPLYASCFSSLGGLDVLGVRAALPADCESFGAAGGVLSVFARGPFLPARGAIPVVWEVGSPDTGPFEGVIECQSKQLLKKSFC